MKKTLVSILSVISLQSCVEEKTFPKPFGFVHIETPKPEYQELDTDCPYSFEYSKYAVIAARANNDSMNCHQSLYYPMFDATIYMSYLPLDTNLIALIGDAHNKVYEHRIKSEGIHEEYIERFDDKVEGMIFDLDGNVALNNLFFVTDTTDHYFIGQLYFNVVPNYDSLKPAIEFIRNDIRHLTQTFDWK